MSGPAACGDKRGRNGGYSRHMAAGEKPCPACRAARTRYNKHLEYRQYLTGGPLSEPALGTQRRLQALLALGWRYSDLADRLGFTGAAAVQKYFNSTYVFASTAKRVRDLYEELSGTPGPSAISRARALAKGWAPPLAWDEGQIDDPQAVSYLELEAAHEEALREDKLRRKRADKAAHRRRLQVEDPEGYAEWLERRRVRNTAYKRAVRARGDVEDVAA